MSGGEHLRHPHASGRDLHARGLPVPGRFREFRKHMSSRIRKPIVWWKNRKSSCVPTTLPLTFLPVRVEPSESYIDALEEYGTLDIFNTEEAVQSSGASSEFAFLCLSFAHAWVKASVFEKRAEPQAPYARHRRGIGRAHSRFLVA
ncbi:MAG: hypothetical protein ACRECP_01185 [Methylocella sp.]